jgi:hypothetical protein
LVQAFLEELPGGSLVVYARAFELAGMTTPDALASICGWHDPWLQGIGGGRDGALGRARRLLEGGLRGCSALVAAAAAACPTRADTRGSME